MSQRHLSKVIWFGTKSGGKFGFIDYKDHNNDGIFFHKNQILSPSDSKLHRFTEDSAVSFNVRFSTTKEGKLEAYDVLLIEDEKDIDFLLDVFFSYIQDNNYKYNLFSTLKDRLITLLENSNNLEKEDFIRKFDGLFNESIAPTNLGDIQAVCEVLSKFYTPNNLTSFEKIINFYFSAIQKTYNISSIKLEVIWFSNLYQDYPEVYDKVVALLKTRYQQDYIHYLLWTEGLEDSPPLNYISRNILPLSRQSKRNFLNKLESYQNSELLVLLTQNFEQGLVEIKDYRAGEAFFNTLNDLGLKSHELKFLNHISAEIKINLWLNEIINFFDIDEYFSHFYLLDTHNQQKAFKKSFNLAHKGMISLDLPLLSKVKTTDYSTKVVIELLKKLNNSEIINKFSLKGDLLRLIADLVTDSKDILLLKGFFDICTGRTREISREVYSPDSDELTLQYFKEKNEEPEYISPTRREPIICEGRLSVSKNGNLNLSKGNQQFWWCKNLPCLDACRVLHPDSKWQNYSIIDFLNILNIQHNTNDIELLYATINKVNRYFERLNCRDCKRILKPIVSSNYAFDRVNEFQCDNESCHNNDIVYLTHCANGRCENVVDSRDVAPCSNNWYICNSCFACCSSKVMQRRNKNLRTNGQDTNAITSTHQGKFICCSTCGNHLNYKDPRQQAIEYNNTLKDFERLATIEVPLNQQKLIGKHGVNKYGNKWFVIYQSHYSREAFLNYLYYWQSLGFNIPDFPENLNKSNYLVSEPIKKRVDNSITHFNCRNCNSTYDLSDDWQRIKAVQYWHFTPND